MGASAMTHFTCSHSINHQFLLRCTQESNAEYFPYYNDDTSVKFIEKINELK